MITKLIVVATAIAANFAIAAPAGAATPAERAQEAASDSPQALRSFVHRTRMIYALNIRDFTTVSDEATEPTGASPQAAPDESRSDKELAEFREQIYRDMQHE
jgi:hypothetical protein